MPTAIALTTTTETPKKNYWSLFSISLIKCKCVLQLMKKNTR